MSYKKLAIVLSVLIIGLTFFFFRNTSAVGQRGVSKTTITPEKIASVPTLSLETIFDGKDASEGLPKDHLRTIIATGDVIPARSVNVQTVKHGDFLWPYRYTASYVKDADLTFINLETPLLKNCPMTTEGMIFCGSNRHVEGLLFAGVDVASLANNHAGNHGTSGVMETKELLEKAGIEVTGIKGAVYKEIRGLWFAFLGYNDIGAPEETISWAQKEDIKKEISTARKNADIVIVTYHWGVEYRDQPDERQKELGHFTIDSGADMVIGNHPHWIQPVELYKGKLITYAHGNYIFDQMWSQKTREGVIGKYVFYDTRLIDVEYAPLVINDFGQAKFAEATQKLSLLKRMETESYILHGQYATTITSGGN